MRGFHVRTHLDAVDFRAFVEPFLMEEEATHCLQLGLLPTFIASPRPAGSLVTVEVDGEIALVATRTSPYALALSAARADGAVRALAESLHRAGSAAVPRVIMGPAAVADRFVAEWTGLTGERPELDQRQGIYRLEGLQAPDRVEGGPRLATGDDRTLLNAWIDAFCEEALAGLPRDAREPASRWLERPDREAWIWEVDGRPVSMAAAGHPTPNGVRISHVFTPPEHRRHGFAAALVAHVSARQLARGRRECFLFTDLDNPTSNRVYRRLGYRRVQDMHVYLREVSR